MLLLRLLVFQQVQISAKIFHSSAVLTSQVVHNSGVIAGESVDFPLTLPLDLVELASQRVALFSCIFEFGAQGLAAFSKSLSIVFEFGHCDS